MTRFEDVRVPPALLAALLFCALPFTSRAYDPTSDYETRQMSGWTLHISQKLSNGDPVLTTNVLRLLDFQLYQVTRAVPEPALSKIRATPIWIELNDPKFPCMCYHPSPEWLRTHDVNPDKAGGVEIANASNFLSWTHDQPWMVLHELSHSYHHKVLGYDNPQIHQAYLNARASGKYDKVLRISGRMERHYAMNNDQEYFAEASEAYFGCNDFYPFVRSELQAMDPGIYQVLENAWRGKSPPALTTNPPPVAAQTPIGIDAPAASAPANR